MPFTPLLLLLGFNRPPSTRPRHNPLIRPSSSSSLSSSRSILSFADLVGLYAVQSGVISPAESDVPKLRGAVPWTAMAPLTALQTINLDSNEVSGAPFTADVAKLTSLQTM